MVEVRKFVYDQIPYELFIFKKLIIHSSNEGTCFANKSFKVFVLVWKFKDKTIHMQYEVLIGFD